MREFHKATYRGETHGRREGGVAMKASQAEGGFQVSDPLETNLPPVVAPPSPRPLGMYSGYGGPTNAPNSGPKCETQKGQKNSLKTVDR